MWRDYVLCLSFANLVYLRAWTDLRPMSAGGLFFRKTLPGINLYLAIAGDVLVLSLLAFLIVRLRPNLPRGLQRALPIAAIAMVMLALRSVAGESTGLMRSELFRFLPPKVLLSLAALLGVGVAVFAVRFSSLTNRIVRASALAAAPCLFVTLIFPLFYQRVQSPLPPDPPLASHLAGSPPMRVIWMIFDEWDERLTFNNRAAGIRMPVIDGLARKSFVATNALAVEAGTPVAGMATSEALPELLYGKRLVKSVIEDAATRNLRFEDGSSTVFGQGASVFARIRSQGWNSAVAGWYLPYCRVFRAQLIDCYWDEEYTQASSAGTAVIPAALDETRMLFETSMFSVSGPSLVTLRHAGEYKALLAAAKRFAANPAIGMAFIHFNIPHTPYFYDPKTGGMTNSGYSADLYDATLELVDRTVGDVLAALDSAGLEKKTAIILSSDHPARFATRIDGRQDPRVPFIVYLPGETAGVVCSETVFTIRTADLVLAIIGGKVKSPSEVRSFLDSHNRSVKSF